MTRTRQILLIDDDPEIRALIQNVLGSVSDWEIRTAASGPEGICFAKTESPDVILLDLMMPEMNGTEVLARLRADPRLQDIPVLIISGTVTESDQQALLDQGARGFAPKPFRAGALMEAIRGVLG